VHNDFSKENIFILDCLKRLLSKTFDYENVSLPGSLNWDYIITTSDLNGVIPLLAKTINLYLKDSIPSDVLNTVTEMNREIAVSNLVKLKELFNIDRQLKETEINTLVLKGPGMGAEIYGDLSLRPFGDLDILINKENVAEAVKILKYNGYEYCFDLTEKQIEIYKKSPIYLIDHDMHYSFYNPLKSIYLELHWALMPEKYSFSQDINEIFSNAVPVSVNSGRFDVLGDEDLIIYLSIHGAKHYWSRMIWIFDITSFIERKKNINWELVIAKSEELNCRRSLLLSLYLAGDLFSVEIPKIFGTYINNDKAVSVLGENVKQNFQKIYDLEKIETYNKTFFLKSMESTSDKLLYIADLLFNPTIYEVEVIIFPKELSFLYYILRPLRLIKKYLLKIFSY